MFLKIYNYFVRGIFIFLFIGMTVSLIINPEIIEDENDIANIYDDIKGIKIVKPFKNPVILNEYNIYMGDDYISLSLSEEFIKVNDETFRIIDSGDNYKELLREIKESFLN